MSRRIISTVLAVSFAAAVANGERKTPTAPLAFSSEHEDWKQFNADHVSTAPVESYLAQLELP